MNININKDFEKEYKDESFRGFSMKEAFWIGAALCAAVGTSIYCYYRFQVPLNMVLYVGIFPALPFLVMGFYRYQDMSLAAFMKELLYERKIKKLCYVAGEYESEIQKMPDRSIKKLETKRKKAQKRSYRKMLRESRRKR